MTTALVDFYATEPHFLAHLAPIWRALEHAERGRFFVNPALAGDVDLEGLGTGVKLLEAPPNGSRPTVVAAYGDLKRARAAGRPVIIGEHGAGQSYRGVRSGSYIGAADRRGVILVLVPGPRAAAAQTLAHPDIPVAVVGCPKLDRWHRAEPKERGPKPTVAVSFHWDAKVCQETRSTFHHYRPVLYRLSRTVNLIGHGHPRMMGLLSYHYDRLRIESVPNFEEVLARADLYAVDNSSTLFEFASTGRPVVVLNGPLFRRDVEHGLRFWEFADIGPNVNDADRLIPTIERALELPDPFVERRRQITEAVYGVTDGTAAATAATAIRSFLVGDELPTGVKAETVPEGNIADVLGWVGENQARADLARETERRRHAPRKHLLRALEKV